MDSNSENRESNNEDTDQDSGTLRKKRLDEIMRQEVRKNIANQMLLPPPEELFKKTVVENEQARTGAPIPFLKFGRLLGEERIEKLNPDNKPEQPEVPPDISPAQNISDYLINAKLANKLVYCRFGEKYVADLEKRKNSNITALNAPSQGIGSASYLINIKKLIDEHNIEGEKKDFKIMKTQNMKINNTQVQPYYKLADEADKTLLFESRFESGNLLAAIKVTDNEYDLVLQNDINTNGHTQWYFFRVGNTRKGESVKFNILNLAKPDSLYNYGMKILCFSSKAKQLEGIGWHRVGSSINYYGNQYKRDSTGLVKYARNFFTLTFTIDFEYDDDQTFFSHCFPYTYSDL
jgi:hypothetical protein